MWAQISESAGTGRQARLRGVCQPTWEFKSPLSHQKNPQPYRLRVFLISSALAGLYACNFVLILHRDQ
jgi:hypothetical protein